MVVYSYNQLRNFIPTLLVQLPIYTVLILLHINSLKNLVGNEEKRKKHVSL